MSLIEGMKTYKKCVYLVVRFRPKSKGSNQFSVKTLGTAFIASPNRFVSASHVFNDEKSKDKMMKHKDGDHYWLINRDENGECHVFIHDEAVLEDTLYLFPEHDSCVLYFKEKFYNPKGERKLNRNTYLPIDTSSQPIATDVAVLGYPLVQLEFNNQKPQLGNILLRVDKGIINTRYKTINKNEYYEYTIAFNPGNSGGPIINIETGKVISIVQASKTLDLRTREKKVPENVDMLEGQSKLQYKQKTFVDTITANYSLGISSNSLKDEFKKHKVI